MNPNKEYEKFTQEIYQELVNNDVLKPTRVLHNVKIKGKSGQEHQIDVYWEYEIAGSKHKVAIECKNYDKTVAIGKVRDFYGVLSDLNNVAGIMVTKVGYQAGAKKYALEYGIELKELRAPFLSETIFGPMKFNINISTRHCLFLVDEKYSQINHFNLVEYRRKLNEITQDRIYTTHIPLTLASDIITDSTGTQIASLDAIRANTPMDSDSDIIHSFEDAYVQTIWGRIKINEIKFEYEYQNHNRTISMYAKDFVKAILIDAMSGDVKLIGQKESFEELIFQTDL